MWNFRRSFPRYEFYRESTRARTTRIFWQCLLSLWSCIIGPTTNCWANTLRRTCIPPSIWCSARPEVYRWGDWPVKFYQIICSARNTPVSRSEPAPWCAVRRRPRWLAEVYRRLAGSPKDRYRAAICIHPLTSLSDWPVRLLLFWWPYNPSHLWVFRASKSKLDRRVP